MAPCNILNSLSKFGWLFMFEALHSSIPVVLSFAIFYHVRQPYLLMLHHPIKCQREVLSEYEYWPLLKDAKCVIYRPSVYSLFKEVSAFPTTGS